MGHIFLRLDTTHVIAGYEPTGEGEIALGAMMLTAADTERNWLAFLWNLLVHEVGHVVQGTKTPAQRCSTVISAAPRMAEAFRPGRVPNVQFTARGAQRASEVRPQRLPGPRPAAATRDPL